MGFFYRIFLSRIIGAEGLGLYQMIFPILALALSVTSAGLSTAISHHVSRKNALGDKRGIWNIFFAGAAFSLLLSFLAAGLLRSYAGVLAEVFLNDVRCEELLKYLALAIPFASLHAIVTGCFIGRKKTGLPALSQLFEQLVRILSSLLIWQIFQEKGFAPTPLIAVGGMLASEILTSLLTLLLLLFQTPVFAPPSLSIMRKSLEKLTEIAPMVKEMERFAEKYSADPEEVLPEAGTLETGKSYREKKAKPLIKKIVPVMRSVYRAYPDLSIKLSDMQR